MNRPPPPRPPYVPNTPSRGTVYPQQPAPYAGMPAPQAPVIVRPTASKVIPATLVQLQRAQGQLNVAFQQVTRWDCADPSTARPVRVTMSGQIVSQLLADFSAVAFVEWGSQSGAIQGMYVPIPCDFTLTAIYVNVKAAVCERGNVAVPPVGFSGVNNACTVALKCSVSEGLADDGPQKWAIAYKNPIPASGHAPLLPYTAILLQGPQQNALVSDVIASNYSANGTWLQLLDRNAGYTPNAAVDTPGDGNASPLWLPAGATQSVSYQGGRPFFQGIACCLTQSPGGGAFDTVNTNVTVEIRGWAPFATVL